MMHWYDWGLYKSIEDVFILPVVAIAEVGSRGLTQEYYEDKGIIFNDEI